MLVQFGYGFLSGISITFLKDTDGPFLGAINFGEFILAVFVPRIDDFLAKCIPLYYHFYLQ